MDAYISMKWAWRFFAMLISVLIMSSICLTFTINAQSNPEQTLGQTSALTHHNHTNRIPQFTTLKSLLTQADQEKKPILLLFSQYDCVYCESLKQDVIQPLLVNEGESRLLIREIYQDSHQRLPKDDIVQQLKAGLNIDFYPTIAFVDAKGNQVAEPILGYQPSNDFYSYYLEEAIEKAIEAVKHPQ